MIKLHIGCGKRDFGDDWCHVDGGDYSHLDYKDVTSLDFKDNSVDLIYSSHLITYFDRAEIVSVLSEWKRVLKPKGLLRIATPDFEAMIDLYYSTYSLKDFLGPLFGKMQMGDRLIYHKTTYDFESLNTLLTEVGFVNVKRYDWRETHHAKFDDHSQAYIPKMDKENGVLISLNVECKKL